MSDYPLEDELYGNSEAAGKPSATHLFNQEVEEALLGAVLLKSNIFIDIASVIGANDFYIERNKWIWEVFQELFDREQSFDVLTVSTRLNDLNRLAAVGGEEYLFSLSSRVSTSLGAVNYASIVRNLSIRRSLLHSAEQIVQDVYNANLDVDGVLEQAEKRVFDISQERTQKGLVPIRDVAGTYLQRISENTRTEGISGLPTGISSLDQVLDGLQPSDLIIVAGRPGMGKTGFMLGIAKHVGLNLGKNVAFFSLEMSAEQMLQRILSQQTEIDSQHLRSLRLEPEEEQRVVREIGMIEQAKIYIDDTPAISPLQMRSKCRRLQMELKGLDLVIVDYLQLMSGDRRTENRVQEVSYISRYLKLIARELKVPVIAAAQLSRAVEQRQDKTLMLSDLRESGSLEQDADVVLFINRNEAREGELGVQSNKAKLVVAKHRNGPVHPGIEVVFISRLAMFKDVPYQNRPDVQ